MHRWWSLVTLSLALLARLPATAMAAEPSSPGEGPSVETVSVSTGSALALPVPSLEPEVLAARGIGSPRPGHRARAIPVLSAERARILLRSLTVPGWGQATAGRPTAARVFGIAELGVWATFAGFRIQEQMRRESYERTARILAGIDLRGRDDEFRRIVGAYISSDEYNQLVVFRDAANLLRNGVYVVCEGANMPSTKDAVDQFLDAKILFGPGKAANAGGVATSGLEMAQNSMRIRWTREEVDARLFNIMRTIHEVCARTAEKYGTPGNYVNGANIAGFTKVADAMMDQGLV